MYHNIAQLLLLQDILNNYLNTHAVADLKLDKLTSVQNCLHFRANISMTSHFNSLPPSQYTNMTAFYPGELRVPYDNSICRSN